MSRSMAADAENCRRGREFTKNFHVRKAGSADTPVTFPLHLSVLRPLLCDIATKGYLSGRKMWTVEQKNTAKFVQNVVFVICRQKSVAMGFKKSYNVF